MKQTHPSAFTLIEIIIVTVIIMTLAAIAVSQTSTTQQFLRLDNALKQTVFFLQRARTLALTQAEAVNRFGVDFSEENSLTLFASTLSERRDLHVYPSGLFHSVERGPTGGASCLDAQITFDRETAQTRFFCGGTELTESDADDLTLFVRICQVSAGTDCSTGTVTNDRSFIIHRAAGVPQF